MRPYKQRSRDPEVWRNPGCSNLKWKLLGDYQHSALRKNLDWNLSPEEFESLILSSCRYCGLLGSVKELRYKTGDDQVLTTNGIDSVDNLLGYSVLNCVSCCSECNHAKRTMDPEAWRELCLRISSHIDNWG